jgi:hypothetical protein
MYAGQAGQAGKNKGDHLCLPGLRLNNFELLPAFHAEAINPASEGIRLI